MRRPHCRHYRGLMIDSTICAVGVDVQKRADFNRPGMLNRMPCVAMIDRCGETAFTCGLASYPTQEELAAEEAESMRRTRVILPFLMALKAENAPGTYGTVPCPLECGGQVEWVRSSRNGHMAATCSTPNCLGVIE